MRLLPWSKIKARIVGYTPTGKLTEFAAQLGCDTSSVRKAAEGKCPRILRRMQAILGPLHH